MFSFFQSHRQSFVISGILVLTFLIYSPAVFHEFVNLDDPARITNNPLIRSLSLDNIKRIFTSLVVDLYTPLTTFSFALEYHFVGLHPFLYHLTNILLHLGVVFMVFRLGMSLGLRETWAGVAAFIFALHPMHVESVAWVTERKDVLYSVFYLGAVLSYLSYLKTKDWRAYGVSLLLGLLSILAKPMALSLPLVLLLCDWFIKGSLRREDWLNKLPYGLFIVPLAWVSFSPNTYRFSHHSDFDILSRFWAAGFYLKKFLWPANLVVHYIPSLPARVFYFEYWSAILIVGISIFGAWRNKWFRFAFLWWLLSIFFLLNFHPGDLHKVTDRYMYLPSVGFCFFSGYFVRKIWEEKIRSSSARRAALAVLVSIAMVLSGKTFFQIGVWKDSFSLWNHTVQGSPRSYWAYNYRGRIFYNRKQFKQAKADFMESIRLNPYYEKAYINMAFVCEKEGDAPAAIENYSKAVILNPQNKVGFNNRGLLYQKTGNTAAALSDFDKAIAADSRYALAYANRGALFLQMNLLSEAAEDCRTAVRLNALHPQRPLLSLEFCQAMGEGRRSKTDDPGESPL